MLGKSLATALYDPLHSGRDDSWLIVVMLVAVHAGLGLGVGRAWVLALPLLLCVTWFVLEGAEGLAWLVLVFGAPLLLAATAVGLVVARVARRRGDRARCPALVVCGAVALAVPAWTAIEHLRHGPHIPPERQAQLPVDTRLVNLCEASGISRRERRALRASVDVLLEELRERPRHLVTYTYYWADDPPEERDITVRELTEEQLKGLELASESDLAVHGRRCAPGITRRLREGL